jgi:hypothetical protein
MQYAIRLPDTPMARDLRIADGFLHFALSFCFLIFAFLFPSLV